MDGHGRALTASVVSRAGRALLVAVPLAFLAVFFVFPVLSILDLGLRPGGTVDLTPLADVVADPDLRGVLWFTLWQAVVSTVLTCAVALPGAYVLARYRFAGRNWVRAVVVVPFVLPTVVVASAFTSLLGPRGPLGVDLRYTVWAILAAHVFFNYALVVRTVGAVWSQLDPRTEDAARVLGAARWRVFTTVTFPLLRPALVAAATIVFLFTFTSFGVVLILGGPRFATLDVEIWRQTTQLLDLPTAGALAVLQLVAMGLFLGVWSRAQEHRSVQQRLRPADETARRPVGVGQWTMLTANLVVMAVLLGAPLVALVESSFDSGHGYGLGAWRSLFDPDGSAARLVSPLEAVRNSLLFAVLATALAVVVGMAAAVVVARRRGVGRRSLDVLLMLPLATSAVTVGFGFLVALDQPPLDLRTSPLLIPIAHALVAVPFVVRAVVPVMRAVDDRLREAAAVLGAPPGAVWREVDLPLIGRGLLVGAGFAFAVSLGEFGATLFIARPDYPTVPVAVFRLLGQPGSATFTTAMAMSVVLMVLTTLAVVGIERFRLDGAHTEY